MDKKGLELVKEVVDTGVRGSSEIFPKSVDEGEDVPFVDVMAFNPANILNALHKATLLEGNDNRARGREDPSLQLVQTAALGSGGYVTMTFLDKNSENAPLMSTFMPRGN